MALNEAVRQKLSALVEQNRVVLFMKGTRRAPQCGFSAQVVQILDDLLPEYETVDVLRSPDIREGIKEFSEWPTIPQLFVEGRFIGGCDIVRDMYASQELQKLLGADGSQLALPNVIVSDSAKKAFAAALGDADGEVLHLTIDSSFVNDLYFAPRAEGELEVQANGVSLLLDRGSARRADGVSIDFVEGENGGFKITNPNEPPKVKQISAPELKAMLERNEIVLFDVRPEGERALAKIEQAHSLDEEGQKLLFSLDRRAAVAFHCHHGVRSQEAASQLIEEGFRNVYNLRGGIAAWSELVDSSVPRY